MSKEGEIVEAKSKSDKLRAVLSSIILSFVLMVFPVASGVIVVINDMGAMQTYYVQGIFMMLSIAVPVIYMWIAKIKPYQIGITKMEKGSFKKVLYFIPIIAGKIGFLLYGINNNLQTVMALAFFTIAIGLSEELYFRGIILSKLRAYFTVKQSIILSSVFFAVVHASQILMGAGFAILTLTIINALIFGIIASEVVVLTKSIIPVIIWHALYDFINWISPVKGAAEIILIIIQSVIMVIYACYLWSKLSKEQGYFGDLGG